MDVVEQEVEHAAECLLSAGYYGESYNLRSPFQKNTIFRGGHPLP